MTFNSPEKLELPPYRNDHGTRTHWWSSPNIAKIRLVDGPDAQKNTEIWQNLETKYFDHIVPQGSDERELVPIYEFVREDGKLQFNKVSPAALASERESFDDDAVAQATESWPYQVNVVNSADRALSVEYLQDGQWLQVELVRNELISIGAESRQVSVRLCDCYYEHPTAVGGWMVTALDVAKTPYTYELFVNRKGNVDLRAQQR